MIGKSPVDTLPGDKSGAPVPQRRSTRKCARDPPRRMGPVTFKAEYIWIDGTEPTAKLRSKTKILADGAELPIWGFDGSSTNQAEGHASDRVLKPVVLLPGPDPRRRRRPRACARSSTST